MQNIPSHNKEIRLLFKAAQKDLTIESENDIFEVLEDDEVETVAGYKKAKDLSIDDKLILDGNPENIANIEFLKNKHINIYMGGDN